MKKLTHWKVRDSQERLETFPCWTEVNLSQENFDESATQASLKSTVSSQLELLHTNFVHYFPAENMAQLEQSVWIRNHFQADNTSYFV